MDQGGFHHPVRAFQKGGPKDQRLEDSWNILTPVPGGGNSVVDGVQETDVGSGAFLPGEAVGLGIVHILRVGDGAWVAGGPHAEAAW